MEPARVDPRRRFFDPRGAAQELLYCRDSELCINGPVGTGKSRVGYEKLHFCATKYPGMRGLIVRKTRSSMTQSSLVTFETEVVPEGHPILRGPSRQNRQSYNYPNGSEIVCGGMDRPDRILSTQYDMILEEEAREMLLVDHETLLTRLRNGVMPYQQAVCMCNPDAPHHWLRQRMDAGKMTEIIARFTDNPRMVNRDGSWTEYGSTYMATLQGLTGSRRLRLVDGKWAAAEGVVYEEFDAAVHVVDRDFLQRKFGLKTPNGQPMLRAPDNWPRYRTVDFGYTNPLVVQLWVQDPDGRLYLEREIYETQLLVEDAAPRAVQLCPRTSRIAFTVCDHDAEDRATLARHGVGSTVPALKEVAAGIQAVKDRLKVQGDGLPRLMIMRDTLAHAPDESLRARALPCCTLEEFDSYVWEQPKEGRAPKEEPVKLYDHGMDAMRYLVAQIDMRGAGSTVWPKTEGGIAARRRTVYDARDPKSAKPRIYR